MSVSTSTNTTYRCDFCKITLKKTEKYTIAVPTSSYCGHRREYDNAIFHSCYDCYKKMSLTKIVDLFKVNADNSWNTQFVLKAPDQFILIFPTKDWDEGMNCAKVRDEILEKLKQCMMS